MKKVIYILIATFALLLSGCDHSADTELVEGVYITTTECTLRVEDNKQIRISGSRSSIDPIIVNDINTDKKFTIVECDKHSVTIQAKAVGVDTLIIPFIYVRGIFAYGEDVNVIINIIE